MTKDHKIRFIRRARALMLALLLLLAPLAIPTFALEADALVPIGRTAGIKLYADGVVITALNDIRTADGTCCPAREAGLKAGDFVTHCNGLAVKDAKAFSAALTAGKAAVLTVKRGTETLECRLTPQRTTDGAVRVGALVRDSLAGIGTITFYDPQSRTFGALGHGICESETGILMPVGEGSLLAAEVESVRRGTNGEAGELIGRFDLTGQAGRVTENCEEGLFGTLQPDELYPTLLDATCVPIGKPADVHCGRAEILANVDGEKIERFAVEIEQIHTDREVKQLCFRVTDAALLAKTGGIVQGMSGSPILQDGKLIGAVTHVLVNDPTRGYGIFIESMLDAAD